MDFTMFFDGLQPYYAPLATIFIFMVMVATDRLFSKRIKGLFLMEVGVIAALILATWLDRCFSGVTTGDLAWKMRTVTTFVNFALSPSSPLLLDMIYKKEEDLKKDLWFFVPVIVNVVLCLFSIKTGWIFYINDANLYTRGPLFFVPFTVCAFYLLSLIYLSGMQKNKPSKKIETLQLTIIMGITGLATLLEIILPVRFLIWSTTEVCVILYFLLLTTQKILYDPLTGAYSRMAYVKQLEKIEGMRDCTIAMIDVNQLKSINDRYGHSVGDEAISGVADAILVMKTKNMYLYRYGGDEFVLLEQGKNKELMKSVLVKAQTFCRAKDELHVSFAFGIAEYSAKEDLQEVIKSADAAMYLNKQSIRTSETVGSRV